MPDPRPMYRCAACGEPFPSLLAARACAVRDDNERED